MIYLLLFLVAVAILAYVTSRWLRGELGELRAWLGEKWAVRRGAESQASLIESIHRAFAAEGLEPDFLVVSRETLPCYRRLRREYLRSDPPEPLPAGIVFGLAADADAGRLYLRAVVTRAGRPARDEARFVDFDAVQSMRRISARLPAGPAPAADEALEIVLADEPDMPLDLALEPAWGPSPAEIATRIRDLVNGDWRPDAPPTVVR